MNKNGKFFVPVERDGSDFKALFRRLAAAGAGRPVDENGFPQGPWTAELLAEAISQIDTNRSGIELRTVQLWFQDNKKGISPDNIRWLARIFGCDDPIATSAWQAELSASQARLTAKRRQQRLSGASFALEAAGVGVSPAVEPQVSAEPTRQAGLARRSEAFFARNSPLDLPAMVFAGAVALGLLSYFLGIHSVTYQRDDGVSKQAGFLWAPNWTLLFIVFMPVFFAFAVDLLTFWKDEGRSTFLTAIASTEDGDGWTRKVEASSYIFFPC